MKTTYKTFEIDYKESGAVIHKDGNFIKAFASDDKGTNEISGLKKSKKYIDSL